MKSTQQLLIETLEKLIGCHEFLENQYSLHPDTLAAIKNAKSLLCLIKQVEVPADTLAS